MAALEGFEPPTHAPGTGFPEVDDSSSNLTNKRYGVKSSALGPSFGGAKGRSR